eukprot:4994711-Pleurochrysis_carterae.AAC.1
MHFVNGTKALRRREPSVTDLAGMINTVFATDLLTGALLVCGNARNNRRGGAVYPLTTMRLE